MSNGYTSNQQPMGGYGGSSTGGGYSASQGPSSPYVAPGAAPASSITSGLGNGVNLQPSYYAPNVDLGWALMLQQSKIRSVRIEIEPGQEKNAQRWIREAVGNGYTVIATYHKFKAPLGTDNVAELMAAAAWWVTNYATLRSSGAFTINLMNEWGSHNITADDFATAYNQALQQLRTVYSGPVVIDLPGYAQEAQVAALTVSGRNNKTIADRNIILSMHVYPESNQKGRGLATGDLDELAATGLGCMIGEFGNMPNSKEKPKTKWLEIVAYAKQKGWPVFGWAWNGDGQGMNMVKPQYGSLPAGQQYAKTGYFNTIYNLL